MRPLCGIKPDVVKRTTLRNLLIDNLFLPERVLWHVINYASIRPSKPFHQKEKTPFGSRVHPVSSVQRPQSYRGKLFLHFFAAVFSLNGFQLCSAHSQEGTETKWKAF